MFTDDNDVPRRTTFIRLKTRVYDATDYIYVYTLKLKSYIVNMHREKTASEKDIKNTLNSHNF